MQLVDDRYEVLEVIASGGMATVYRAVDIRLERPVALKRPHPGSADNDLDARMEREARAAAGLSHPNVVTVYDYGWDEEGPFLVMELVEGPTLQEKAADVSAAEALQIGAQLADGLAAIHAAGVVHRDVKPSNVIMSERGPMLTDFGIAHDGSGAEITDPGTIVATPSYAAPEVLSGQPQTPASDVYSLALVVKQLAGGNTSDVDPGVNSVLEASLSDSPEDRPDAATLADTLRDSVRTLAMAAVTEPGQSSDTSEPTLILSVDQQPSDANRTEHVPEKPRSRLMIGLLLAGLLLGSIWALLAVANRDSGEAAAPATDSTLLASTSTLLTTTTTPTATTTAVQSDPAIAEPIADLRVILLEPPRSDYNQSEVEEVIGQIQDAIESARGGETDIAEEQLNALAKDFAKKLDSNERQDAIALLESIASSVGVEIDDDLDDD